MRRLAHNIWRRKQVVMAVMALAISGAAGLLLSGGGTSAATQYTANVGGGGSGIAVETFRPAVIFVNQGDTVKFVNPYEELHTVTFTTDGKVPDLIVPAGPPPKNGPPKLIFNPKIAFSEPPKGQADFDGAANVGSGLLMKGDSWVVAFTKQGSYKFFCVLHPGMEASVSVLAAGVHVPDQAQRDFEAKAQLAAGIAAGTKSSAGVSAGKAANPNGTTTWDVLNAPTAGQSDVMAFIPGRLQIGVGDTVNWKNNNLVPHTVSFLAGTPMPDLVVPEPQPAGPPNLVVNPRALFPAKTSQNYDGSSFTSSGFIGTGPEATGGTSFSLTFTKAGLYTYLCILHADQGMAGVIEVGGAGATAGSLAIRPPATGDAGLSSRGGMSSAYLIAALAIVGLTSGSTALLLVARRRS